MQIYSSTTREIQKRITTKSLYHKYPNYSASCPRQTDRNRKHKKVLQRKGRRLGRNRMRKADRPLATVFLLRQIPIAYTFNTCSYQVKCITLTTIHSLPRTFKYTVQIKGNISRFNNLCYPNNHRLL